MKVFKLESEFITITQFLKANDYINSGGEAKFFLLENNCLLNSIKITERKKKIFVDDIVSINEDKYKIIP